jgi:hypothetical protein
MYIHSEKTVCKLTTTAFMLFLFAIVLDAQISVTTVVTPPYTSNFESYAEKVKITGISPISGSLRLELTMKGDNGITIKSVETGTISIAAKVVTLVPTDYLEDIFNINYLQVSGISKSELSTKGLPAGTYQVCFKATVSNSDVSYSTNTCSSMFTVSLVQPPRIMQPLCGNDLYRGGIQNILFSWAPSPGAPRWTQYTLRIVEIRDSSLSPAQALKSGTRPPFFEEEVTGTSYLYGPKDPPLEKGCRYAFEVIALDEETNTRFENIGHSEMCYFKYGKEDDFASLELSGPGITAASSKPHLTMDKQPFEGTFFSPANVSGTLYYQYAGPDIPVTINLNASSSSGQTVNVPLSNNTNIVSLPSGSSSEGDTKTVTLGNKKLTFSKVSSNSSNQLSLTNSNLVAAQTGNLLPSFYHTDIRDKSKSKPLENIPISLVVKYMIYDKSSSKWAMVSLSDMQNTYVPSTLITIPPDQVVASGYTGEGGSFDLTFFLKDSLGIIDSNRTIRVATGSTYKSYTGYLCRVLRLIINSNYYCSPAHDIVVQPGESKNYDDLYGLVKTYGLTVKTINPTFEENVAAGPIEGIDVYLMRKTDIAQVPDDEGYPKPASETVQEHSGYKVIAHATTDIEGKVSFKHLVHNYGGYDKYYIYVNSDSHQDFNYKSAIEEYCSSDVDLEGESFFQDLNTILSLYTARFNDEFFYIGSYSKSVDIYPQPPLFYGHISQASGLEGSTQGMAVEDAYVNLFSRQTGFSFAPSSLIMSQMTGESGDYKFSILSSDVSTNKIFLIRAEKSGYASDGIKLNDGAPILLGQKVKKDIIIKPKALLTGKITDGESGTGVQCKLTVIGGESVTSKSNTIEVSATSSSPGQNAFSTILPGDLTEIKKLTALYGYPASTTIKPASLVATTSILGTLTQSKPTVTSSKPSYSAKPSVSNASNINAVNANAVSSVSATQFSATGPSYFALPTPSGQQKIIVDPVNTDYFIDTLTLNLVDGENSHSIMVMKKRYRIRFAVKVISQSGSSSAPGITTITPVTGQFTQQNANNANNSNGSGTVISSSNINTTTTLSSTALNTNINSSAINTGSLQNINPTINIGNLPTEPLANARVRVVGRTDYFVTDARGNAFLEFNGSDQFEIEVLPPEDKDFEPVIIPYSGYTMSKYYKDESTTLKKAARVSGMVTFDGSPVEGATVRLNYAGKDIDTLTASDGTYTLRYIPIESSLDFEATKSGYIGAAQTISVSKDGKENVNFELTKSTEFDYSKMYGFPIEVIERKEDGKTYLSGHFGQLTKNGQVDIGEEGDELTFTDIEISKGSITGESGLPYPVPVTSFKIDRNDVSLSLNETFTGKLESDNNGIVIIKGANDNSGYFKGKVSVNTDMSFQMNAVSFGSEKIYVMSASSDQTPKAFNVIASDGAKPFSGIIPLFNQNGKSINFTLYNFTSEAKAKSSRIDGSLVKLNTTLHTNLQNTGTADLAVDLGDIELTTEHVVPISKTSTITMPLEKWTLKATKWTLNTNGFRLAKGEVVTHMANIAFTNMEVKPESLETGQYDLETMNIRGMTDFKVTGIASLIYENNHWVLAITPSGEYCGYITPFPGMPENQNINVTSVFLKSNKTGSFSVETVPFKLYDVIDFSPTSMSIYDDRIEFPGVVNLNIPDIPERSGLIKYKKVGSEVKGYFQPYSFSFSTKGVDLKFTLDENSLSSAGFTAKGTLSEPGLYSVNVQLNHNSARTEIVDLPGQTFPIDKSGNRKLTGFDGEMHTSSGQWSNFIFSGDLAGANGVSGRLTFVVNGDITADNQSVQMDKIATPFGDLKLTYDFDKGRLIGILEIEQDLAGTGYIKGSAESVVDGSGWYFCAGGIITMKGNPYIKNASTAMLFGDYPSLNDPFITQIFSEYSYSHTLPAAFQSYIKGFYIDGAAEFPVPYVPNIDIDLVVVSAHASVSAGGSFSMGMNFSDEGGTFYTGAAIFVDASIGIGASVGIACAGASFGVRAEFASHGELKTNGDWYLDGSATLTLTGSAYAGCGCCDSDCDGYYICPCISDSWSGSVSLQLLTHMGSDDNYININW